MAVDGEITLKVEVSGTRASGDDIAKFSETQVTSSVSDVIDRPLTVPTSLITVVTIGSVGGQGLSALNGLVIHNEDDNNFVTVGFLTAAEAAYFEIPAGKFFILPSKQIEAIATTGTFTNFADIATVNLQADTSACVCHVVAW